MNCKFIKKKFDDEKMQVFGWASVAGIEDLQNDIITADELENAVYKYICLFGDMGEKHEADKRQKGKIIESVVFTKEKQKEMGLPVGSLDEAWWVGFQVKNTEVWEKIKSGEYEMFSIEGKAERESLQKSKPIKTFSDFHGVKKFQDYNLESLATTLFRLRESEAEAAKEYSEVMQTLDCMLGYENNAPDDILFLSRLKGRIIEIRNDERQHSDELGEFIDELIGDTPHDDN